MTNPNVVLLQTQRLTDNANGGGQMTSTIIPDNQANNLFGPISRINRADGNVSLRKAIAKAISADTATYFGAHAIIAAPPSNPDVSVLMFNSGSWTDVRSQAADFIESYLVQGPQTRLWPYGQQVVGQRSVIAYQPVADALPNIGDTYVIVNNAANPVVSQFVRITSLRNQIQTFTDNVGTFQLNVVTMGISAPLTDTYPGAQAQRYSTPVPDTVLCITNVANAATYYGCQTLTADVASGDDTATLSSIFGQLLPSTQGETPITNATPQGASSLVASGPSPVTISIPVAGAGTFYFGCGILPGTLKVTIRDTVVTIDDQGDGTLSSTSGSGTVDYGTGQFTILHAIDAIIGAVAVPAVLVQQSGYSKVQAVTSATRGYLYVQSMNPIPTPGSTVVSYRALGRWYELRDDGSGILSGGEGTGTGTVDFATGDCVVTTGALPDVDSGVVFSWGQSTQYDIRTGDINIALPSVTFTLTNPAKQSTVTITWVVASVTKTLTDNGSGVLSGTGGTGSIDYGSGMVLIRPTSLPDPSTGYSAAYMTNPATTQNLTPSKSGSTITLNLTGAPIAPHSIHILYQLTAPSLYAHLNLGDPSIQRAIFDDGSGGLIDERFGAIAGASINYTTGVVSFNPDLSGFGNSTPQYVDTPYGYWDDTASPPQYKFATYPGFVGWMATTITAPFVNGSAVTVSSTAASATNVSQTDSFPTSPILLDLTPKTVEQIVPGSVVFKYAGDTYIDRGGGILYRSVSHTTNSGTAAGTIDYDSGAATISDWNAAGAQTLTLQSLLCSFGSNPIGFLYSRVPGQSIRPSSFQIQANRKSDGTLVTATADGDGNWSTAAMTGHIDVATGLYSVQFGESVLDSSLTSDQKAEPWYNSGNVDLTGHIWHPDEALAGTIRYSCVVETILPLSAGVLGLDPVRLPQDGRVPIISAGNTLCFRNPLTFTFTGTVAAGDTVSLPRGGLESVVLYDHNGVQVDIGLYTAALATGIVTMSTPCDLTPYTQPLVATHTQGELVLCTDAEITGAISFSPALVNDYPAASSFVSSCLIADNSGNLQADYDTKFQQTTWNFNPNTLWKDVVQGSSPTAAYDDVDFPIEVLDLDTITQRVAYIFTSSTGGNIAFEELGIIGTFTTGVDSAPVNPATGNPYYILDHRGWGTGWATGNALRFNLRGAGFPIWFARSVQVGATETADDLFLTELRWDE